MQKTFSRDARCKRGRGILNDLTTQCSATL
jgi:hypothetical protein